MANLENIVDIVTKYSEEGRKQVEAGMGHFQRTTGQLDNKTKKYGATVSKTQKNQDKGYKLLNKSQTRFYSGTLSLLFANQALNRTFNDLLSSQYDIWGISDLYSATVTTVMIPAMSDLLGVLEPIFTGFMNLSDITKEAIGWFVIAGAGLTVLAGGFISLSLVLKSLYGINLGKVLLGFLGNSATYIGEISGIKSAFEGLGAIMGISSGAAALTVVGALAAVYMGFKLIKDSTPAWLTAFDSQISKLQALKDAADKAHDSLASLGLQQNINQTQANKIMLTSGSGALGGAVSRQDLAPISPVQNAVPILNPSPTSNVTQMGNIPSWFYSGLSAGGSTLPHFADGGIVPGNIGQATPIIAHGGEQVVPYGQRNDSSGDVNVSATYIVNVADKREFESLLKMNNQQLTEDIRRLVQR